METKIQLTQAQKLTAICLVTAAVGVVVQIISGVPYPKVPPVFFILLIPAALTIFGKWRWTPLIVIIAGLFLTMGLFSSGAYTRLFNISNIGGSVGLWIQMIGVLIATIAGIITFVQYFAIRTS